MTARAWHPVKLYHARARCRHARQDLFHVRGAEPPATRHVDGDEIRPGNVRQHGQHVGPRHAPLVAAEVDRPQRRQRGQHGLPPAPADAAAAQHRVQGQLPVLAGVREEGLDTVAHRGPGFAGFAGYGFVGGAEDISSTGPGAPFVAHDAAPHEEARMVGRRCVGRLLGHDDDGVSFLERATRAAADVYGTHHGRVVSCFSMLPHACMPNETQRPEQRGRVAQVARLLRRGARRQLH